MKKFLELWEQDFVSTYKIVLGVSAVMMVFQIILCGITADKGFKQEYVPLEMIIQKAGCDKLFMVGVFMIIGCIVLNYFFNFYRSKSIYTLMGLPVSEKWLYISKVLTGVLYFLIFICAQLISIRIAMFIFKKPINYKIVTGNSTVGAPSVTGQSIFAHNDVYLAFVRSKFLRLIFPLKIQLLVLNFGMMTSVVMSVYYIFLCLMSNKKVRWLLLIVVNFVTTVMIIIQRANEPDGKPIIWYVLLLIIGTIGCIVDSLWLIKRRAYI